MLQTSVLLVAGMLVLFPMTAAAQGVPSATVAPLPGDDSDPTRPVAWSLREEYYNLPQQAWNNAFLFRIDRGFLSNRHGFVGRRGILTRFDLPLAVAGRPDGTTAGLGDIYWQGLVIPYLTSKFAFAWGSGFSLPTATDRRLGTGKLTVAPIVAPIWFIPQRGFAFVKVQDYVSVAGNGSRRDLHYMTVTPLLVWRLRGKPYWMQFDGESNSDWNANRHTAYKAGFLVGRMIKKRTGAWAKIEVGMGSYRSSSLAIKTSIFKVR